VSKRTSVFALLGIPLIVTAAVLSFAAVAVAAPFVGSREEDRTMFFEGTGQAIIWPYWRADGATDTLLEVVNRLTRAPNTGSTTTTTRKGRYVLIHLIVHEDKNSEDVSDFNVCLSPGDVWTGTLTLVGARVHLKSTDLSATDLGVAPVDVALRPRADGTNPTQGYAEAVMIDNGTSVGAGCNGDTDDPDIDPISGNNDPAEFDLRFQGTKNPLFGRVIYVNTGAGLAAGMNAEAIEEFCDRDLKTPFSNCTGAATVRNSIEAFRALAMGDEQRNERGVLMSRWLRNTATSFDTQAIVTFPTGKTQKFNFCLADTGGNAAFGTTDCGGGNVTLTPLDFSITATTTMALWVKNDEECASISPRQIPVPNEVNVITFSLLDDALFRTTTNAPGGVCKKPETLATSGWFRLLFDTDENEVTDAVTGSYGTAVETPEGTIKVPRLIPMVGFVTMSAPAGAFRLSATFPWHSETPLDHYDCEQKGDITCKTNN